MKWRNLIFAVLICQVAGVLGSIFTSKSISTWYTTLAKPEFQPPNWLFGPVWIALYTLMGISVFMIWQKGWKKKEVKTAIVVFGIQLVLNAIWSPLFFGLQNLTYAFIDIIFLWVAIYITIIVFFRISRNAAWLLVPYWLWVTFALLLNHTIMALN